MRSLKQSSNNRNLSSRTPSFKLFDRVHLRFKPGSRYQRIVRATCLVCIFHLNCLIALMSGVSRVRGVKQSQRASAALHSNCFTVVISGINRVAGLKESSKQRASSALFIAFSSTAFISSISRDRGLKRSSNNRNVPGLHPSFKLFDRVYQRYKPR